MDSFCSMLAAVRVVANVSGEILYTQLGLRNPKAAGGFRAQSRGRSQTALPTDAETLKNLQSN